MQKDNIIILLDNGHGIDTSGKCSPDKSLLEYKWAREITNRLHDELAHEGIASELIVKEEKDIPLATRCSRANDIYKKAKQTGKTCVLISVHINAATNAGWSNATGWTVWVANNASNASKLLAQTLYQQAEKKSLQGNRCVPSCKYWQAGFYILKNTNMPAVLTENLFMTNKQEVAYLLSEKGKQEIVNLHVEGIKEYIAKL